LMKNKVFEPTTRQWVYGIAVSVFGLLSVYGFIEANQLAAWLALASAVCGLAFLNTPSKLEKELSETTDARRAKDGEE
ncbi:hypothetical protein, partial [Alicyclobacillus fructus]